MGVINLFSDVKRRIFFIRSKFLQEVANMKEKKFGGRGFEKIDFRAGISIEELMWLNQKNLVRL